MKRYIGAVIVVVLVAVGVVGVVFASTKSNEKAAGIASSIVAPVDGQLIAEAGEKSCNPQNLAVGISPEPCSMVLVGVGGLIFIIGKRYRRRRRRA